MKPKRKQRLILILLLLVGLSIAVSLTLMALKQNMNFFFSPSQIVAGEAPQGISFRIGGMVVDNSIERSDTDLGVSFEVTDTAQTVTVEFTGILPDLFREGQGIVALGKLEGSTFKADEVLAKHDENYMPPEVTEALKNANKDMYANPEESNN
ncbi:MAG: cytochrome c-type biogenesis protein CcmE [Gammaproteobacteria bacterium]|jgi:cytochrome c-type biogenesis protein CcmE